MRKIEVMGYGDDSRAFRVVDGDLYYRGFDNEEYKIPGEYRLLVEGFEEKWKEMKEEERVEKE